ncbi:MAG: FecR domain-containing protein [Planctomycetota bacterium]|jgi:ferric-dicitrate binding protein FerR (iron transport regulator)
MNCEAAREELYELYKGRLEKADAQHVRGHVESCSSCREELASLRGTLEALSEIEGITPSLRVPDVSRAREHRTVRTLVGVAVAASLVVAALSFLLLFAARPDIAATVSKIVPPDGAPSLQIGQSIPLGEVFTAETFVELALPDVGILKLDRGTRIEFETHRRVRIFSGDLFAEVYPAGKGFVVEAPGATATVLGTSFGVRVGDAVTVYVVKGQVRFSGSGLDGAVDAGSIVRTGVVPMLMEGGRASEFAAWIRAYESPDLWVHAEPGEKSWTVVLNTNSPVPVVLGSFEDSRSRLYAEIEPAVGPASAIRLDADAIEVEYGLTDADGTMRLDASHPCRLSVRLKPELFQGGAGRYRVRIWYYGTPEPGEGDIWMGRAASPPAGTEIGD